MKALCRHGTGDVRVDTVADPTIQDPRDVVIKITSTAICGSDLHLFNGFQPTMKRATSWVMKTWVRWSRLAAASRR
jgi:threonine dehydrogenase-like Zn-dependent dehydrogenase